MLHALQRHLDIGVAIVLSVAALGAYNLPDGTVARAVVTGAFLVSVPGFLALQAAGVRAGLSTVFLMAIGLSLALVGLFALAATWLPGGMVATNIVAVTMVSCLALAAIAVARRERFERAAAPQGA